MTCLVSTPSPSTSPVAQLEVVGYTLTADELATFLEEVERYESKGVTERRVADPVGLAKGCHHGGSIALSVRCATLLLVCPEIRRRWAERIASIGDISRQAHALAETIEGLRAGLVRGPEDRYLSTVDLLRRAAREHTDHGPQDRT